MCVSDILLRELMLNVFLSSSSLSLKSGKEEARGTLTLQKVNVLGCDRR